MRRCTTTQGPACSTVHGTDVPSSANTCVIPSLIPMMPLTAIDPVLYLSSSVSAFTGADRGRLLAPVLPPECFDFHVHARRQVQLHQRIHRIRRGIQNVD